MQSSPSEAVDDARVVRSRLALRAAMVAMLAQRPFAEITVAPLVEQAGVGYATFFRHYSDKEALLADVAGALISDLAARMMPFILAGDGLSAARALVARIEEERVLCRALLCGAGDRIRQTVTELALAQSLATSPEPSSRLPRELRIIHVSGATLTILGWWLRNGETMSADDLAEILFRLVIAPASPDLVAQPGRPDPEQ